MDRYNFTVGEKFNNYKAVDFLRAVKISKEIIQRLKFGGILVNGLLLNNVNTRLKCGDVVTLCLPEDEQNPYVVPVKGELEILYEDDYLLAVNKPKGMLTHASKNNKTPSLDGIVCGYFDKPFTFRAINRLDRDTSGVMLIAKDMVSACFLGEAMKRGEIKKTYTALVVGKPQKDHFIIDAPIARQSTDGMKRIVSPSGKPSLSECFFVKALENGLSLVDVLLHTGRTHQIRVHLSHIGHPLYADRLYGTAVLDKTYFLHAKSLTLTHPFTSQSITLTAPINIDF